MKVIYCNPSFWDYRLPFYLEMNRLLNNGLYIIYSTKRFQNGHKALLEKIKNALGKNAIPYDNELMYDCATHSFTGFTENHRQIPLPMGLWKRISSVNPDALITEGFFQWTPWVIIWSIFHKKPVFLGWEGTIWTERNKSKIITAYRKLVDKFITGYLVNGNEATRYLTSIGIKPEKIHVGGMCADSSGLTSSIAKMSQQEKLYFRSKYAYTNGLVYLFCGRVEKLKGAPNLMDAWDIHIVKHPKDVIILVGTGDSFDMLQNKYRNNKNVFLEGRVEYQSIYKYYAIADVFILPTLKDNWSLVIPEAMACGLPVATSIYNGCHSELVHKDENGFVFDSLKTGSIVDALDYFHNVDLKKFGIKSREIERKFKTESCAKREVDAILNIINCLL